MLKPLGEVVEVDAALLVDLLLDLVGLHQHQHQHEDSSTRLVPLSPHTKRVRKGTGRTGRHVEVQVLDQLDDLLLGDSEAQGGGGRENNTRGSSN